MKKISLSSGALLATLLSAGQAIAHEGPHAHAESGAQIHAFGTEGVMILAVVAAVALAVTTWVRR